MDSSVLILGRRLVARREGTREIRYGGSGSIGRRGHAGKKVRKILDMSSHLRMMGGGPLFGEYQRAVYVGGA
jgi:hypothetical protein